MDVYITYYKFKTKYINAQKEFNIILQEKEQLFTRTQPKSPNLDKTSSGINNSNVFDEYLIAIENKRINARLDEIRSILADWGRLLELKKQELIESTNINDRIYAMRYIDNMTVTRISRIVAYSKSQVYRILLKIQKNLKLRQNATKKGL